MRGSTTLTRWKRELSQEIVVPGLVPGIHVLRAAWKVVDGRDKPGHDDMETSEPNGELQPRSTRGSLSKTHGNDGPGRGHGRR